MDELDHRAAAHVFVVDLEHPVLEDDDAHHLGRVLRLRTGEAVTLSDGKGAWRPARWSDGAVEVVGPVRQVDRPAPAITVGFALVKGDRPEWIVQKLTELGVDTIVPLAAERSVVRWSPERAGRQVERLARVARSAAMQSRRCWLPVVEPVATPRVVASRPGAVLAERGGPPPTLDQPVVLVGPEGGWTADELTLTTGRVGLGDGVLRVETAAVVAGSLLTALRAGLVVPAGPPGGEDGPARR